MKYLIACLFSTIPFFLLDAAPQSWTLQRESQGVRIYQQPTTSGHAITRGMKEMNSSIDAVLSLMRDSSACHRWLDACLLNQTIRTESPSKRLDYAVINSPLFFSDRDMYVYSVTEYDKSTQTLTIKNSGRENYDEGQPNRIRIKSIQAFWQLKKISPTKISVLYQISSNPQILRSSYLDDYVADSVFRTLLNLEKVSKQAPYAHIKVDELR